MTYMGDKACYLSTKAYVGLVTIAYLPMTMITMSPANMGFNPFPVKLCLEREDIYLHFYPFLHIIKLKVDYNIHTG